VSGARLLSRPDRLKIIAFVKRCGGIVAVEIGYPRRFALDRARLAAETSRLRLFGCCST